MTNTTLTNNEQQLLQAITKSDYGNGAETPVWSSYDLLPYLPYTKAAHSGVMSSLVKKGLVECSDTGSFRDADGVVSLTELGKQQIATPTGATTKNCYGDAG